jgi:molybdopterin-guanine dinucleotide biosynthesis protein B
VHPFFLQILGKKDSGKTTLVAGLVHEFTSRGFRVGTVKHTSHDHEFDRPGTDSFRHVQAGSEATVIISPGRLVCQSKRPEEAGLQAVLKLTFADKDVVIWEGHGREGTPVIECVAAGSNPSVPEPKNLIAYAADEEMLGGVATFARGDVGGITSWLITEYRLKPAINEG